MKEGKALVLLLLSSYCAFADEYELHDLTLTMPGAQPSAAGEHLCAAFKIADLTEGKTVYLREFEEGKEGDNAHHVLVEICNQPIGEEGEIWNCNLGNLCKGHSMLVHVSGHHQPPTVLPDGVGFKMGPEDGYLVMQVHYTSKLDVKDFTTFDIRYTEEKPENFAGMLVLMQTNSLPIQPNLEKAHVDLNCKVENPATLFRHRAHTHGRGTAVSVYSVQDYEFMEVARGDPRQPQQYYPLEQEVHVKAGEYLAARCTYDTTEEDKPVRIGPDDDDMCVVYMMFYTPDESNTFQFCMNQQSRWIGQNMPANSDLSPDELAGQN